MGGKSRTLKFNLNANYEFCKMHGLTQQQVMEFFTNSLNVTAIRDMIYCALKSADMSAGRPVDYNEYTVGEWITEMAQDELERIVLGTQDANATNKEKPGKKKVVKPT